MSRDYDDEDMDETASECCVVGSCVPLGPPPEQFLPPPEQVPFLCRRWQRFDDGLGKSIDFGLPRRSRLDSDRTHVLIASGIGGEATNLLQRSLCLASRSHQHGIGCQNPFLDRSNWAVWLLEHLTDFVSDKLVEHLFTSFNPDRRNDIRGFITGCNCAAE